MIERKVIISVIGGHFCTHKVEKLAHEIGIIIAEVDSILLCGGLRGVMEAVSEGAKASGGLTIGILPGKDKNDANPFIDIAIPTSIGYTRNSIVACAADIIVALPGSHGTRSEISYGLVFGRPVIDLGDWNIPGMIKVKNVSQAKKKIQELIKKITKNS